MTSSRKIQSQPSTTKRAAYILQAALLLVFFSPAQSQPLDKTFVENRLKQINSLPMSSGLYACMLRSLGVEPPAPPAYSPDASPGVPPPMPDMSVGPPIRVTYDSLQDAEPSITTTVVGGTRYFVTAYFHYDPNTGNHARIQTSRAADGFQSFTSTQLALPPQPPGATHAFNGSFDSYLASGTAAGYVYLVGMATNDTYLQYTSPNGVFVWTSSDGGLTWGSPATVAVNASDTTHYFDKPHIAVNPNTGSLYVTFLQYNVGGDPNMTAAYVSVGTSDGQYFSPTPTLVATGAIGGPQLAINSSNNNVYLAWADYAANAIQVAISTNNGQTFGAPVTRSARNSILGPYADGTIPRLRSGIRAFTLPTARYNAAAQVLGVVWHERETDTSGNPVITDAYYSYFNGGTWQPSLPLRVSDYYAGIDNFQPALASDVLGNVLIVWYDTNYDPNGILYQPARTYRTYTGGLLASDAVTGFQSNPTALPYQVVSIGDYQDVVSVPYGGFGRFVSAWVGVPRTTRIGDIYFLDYR